MNKTPQPAGEEYFAWALFNWGHPWGTYRTRKEAIEYAVKMAGKPWREARKSFTVVKAYVTPWK